MIATNFHFPDTCKYPQLDDVFGVQIAREVLPITTPERSPLRLGHCKSQIDKLTNSAFSYFPTWTWKWRPLANSIILIFSICAQILCTAVPIMYDKLQWSLAGVEELSVWAKAEVKDDCGRGADRWADSHDWDRGERENRSDMTNLLNLTDPHYCWCCKPVYCTISTIDLIFAVLCLTLSREHWCMHGREF